MSEKDTPVCQATHGGVGFWCVFTDMQQNKTTTAGGAVLHPGLSLLIVVMSFYRNDIDHDLLFVDFIDEPILFVDFS